MAFNMNSPDYSQTIIELLNQWMSEGDYIMSDECEINVDCESEGLLGASSVSNFMESFFVLPKEREKRDGLFL